MSIYIKDRVRWRRTVTCIGFASLLALVVRVWAFDLLFIIDPDTVAFTVSVISLGYVGLTSEGI
jgi:hypothetical protein